MKTTGNSSLHGDLTDSRYKQYWRRLKNISMGMMALPVLLLIVAFFLREHGFSGSVEEYDRGVATIVQYILFIIGALIFFFGDGIANFIGGRLIPYGRDELDGEEKVREDFQGYMAYTFIVMDLMNLIVILGFVGFLICGNFTWLVVFFLAGFFLLFKYIPSPGRFERLLTDEKRSGNQKQ